jgi:hypothetical protein
MTDKKPVITEDEAKQISDAVKKTVDPAYKHLSELSKQLSQLNMAGLEIQTPTGIFRWTPNFFEHSGRTIN